jgi:hypothetical protein
LQRLPPHSIQRAYVVSEIRLEEYPASAGLASRNEAVLGALSYLLGVHLQKGSRLVEIQGPYSTRTPVKLYIR